MKVYRENQTNDMKTNGVKTNDTKTNDTKAENRELECEKTQNREREYGTSENRELKNRALKNRELEYGEPSDREAERMELEQKLESSGWKDAVRKITMPRENREALLERTDGLRKFGGRDAGIPRRTRNTRIAVAAACMLLVLTTSGMTAHAVYVNKHLNVFFETGITEDALHRIEAQLLQLDGVVSCRYIDADTAWKTFGENYLTPEMMEAFDENPLAESASFRVGVSLDADAERMKTLIGELDGVRLVSGLWEE